MAIGTTLTAAGTGDRITAGTTIAVTTTAAINIGSFGIMIIAADNVGTTDGDLSEINSITGGTGTWSKLGEQTNGNGAAKAGTTAGAWLFVPSGSNASGTVFTINFSGSITDGTARIVSGTVGTGNSIRKDAAVAAIYNVLDASAGFGSASFSGMASKERLYVRCNAKELNSLTTITVSSGYSSLGVGRSRNNTAAQSLRGEYKVATSTAETSNPTHATTGDLASIFVALEEFTPVPALTRNPVVTGLPYVGELLTSNTGTWTGSPSSYAYQWKRDGVDISGQTASTYTQVSADIGTLVSCSVTAVNAGGNSSPASADVGIDTQSAVAWVEFAGTDKLNPWEGSDPLPASYSRFRAEFVLRFNELSTTVLQYFYATSSIGLNIDYADDYLKLYIGEFTAGNYIGLPHSFVVDAEYHVVLEVDREAGLAGSKSARVVIDGTEFSSLTATGAAFTEQYPEILNTGSGTQSILADVSYFRLTVDEFNEKTIAGTASVWNADPWLAGTVTDVSSGGITIDAVTGAHALTGQFTDVRRSLRIAAVINSHALTGQVADVRRSLRIEAVAGVHVLAGQIIDVRRSLRIEAVTGVQVLTGQAPTLTVTRVISAVTGTFALTGHDATLTTAATISADAGNCVLTGYAPTLTVKRLVSAVTGVHTVAGFAPSITAARIILAVTGAITLTGPSATLPRSVLIGAVTGALTQTGQAATFTRALRIEAVTGALTRIGQAATLTRAMRIEAGTGVHAVTGPAASLLLQRRLDAPDASYGIAGPTPLFATAHIAATGIHALTGQTAKITRDLRIDAATGVYSIAVLAPTLAVAVTIPAVAGSYALTGADHTLSRSLRLNAVTDTHVVVGPAASLTTQRRIAAVTGSFAVTGFAPTLSVMRLIGGAAGSHVLSGFAPGLTRLLRIETTTGILAATGHAVAISVQGVINAGTAIFTQTGHATAITAMRLVSGVAGSLTVTGLAPTLTVMRSVTAVTGSYAASGLAPALTRSLRIDGGTGALVLTGHAQTISAQGVISAVTGAYDVTGHAPTLTVARMVAAVPGIHSATGHALIIVRSLMVRADFGAHMIAGQAPDLIRSVRIDSPTGAHNLTGRIADIRRALRIVPPAGDYDLTLPEPVVIRALRIEPNAPISVTVTGQEAVLSVLSLNASRARFATPANSQCGGAIQQGGTPSGGTALRASPNTGRLIS